LKGPSCEIPSSRLRDSSVGPQASLGMTWKGRHPYVIPRPAKRAEESPRRDSGDRPLIG
jgi:hypothetical protein